MLMPLFIHQYHSTLSKPFIIFLYLNSTQTKIFLQSLTFAQLPVAPYFAIKSEFVTTFVMTFFALNFHILNVILFGEIIRVISCLKTCQLGKLKLEPLLFNLYTIYIMETRCRKIA